MATRNPITLARRVLEETPHVLLVGAGACQLGNDMEQLDPAAEPLRRWQEALAAGRLQDESFGDKESVDTVGAVALDPSGVLAGGSSTGGVFGKLPGRVGDAAVFGAGVFASRAVAVVGSGVGELFLEALASFRVGLLIERGHAVQSACRRVIELVVNKDPRPVGLLALDAEGNVGAAFYGAEWNIEGAEGRVIPEFVPRGHYAGRPAI